ncbi:MAG: hypothetical protein FJ090_03230 [Deltaproteobacteria bacterium]|nr:hypothetical protein [Deltaproteobacteria bacterium]
MVLGLLFACIKPTPTATAGAVPVAVATLMLPVSGEASAAPPDFEMGLAPVLNAHGTIPTFSTSAADAGRLAARGDTAQRIAVLREAYPGAILLVETEPSYYSEMNGQYRWTVGVTLTITEGNAPPVAAEFDVPVFLAYHHEREAEAVAAATPVVSRRVGQLLDTWIAGRE